MTTETDTEKLPGLIRKAIELLAEMGAGFADDGSNEPLELARDLDDALSEYDAARAQPASVAHPPEPARDAARYRWLRECGKLGDDLPIFTGGEGFITGTDFDETIDAAMARESGDE